MRVITTNLENRRSPWTDLIALIKVHLYSAVKIANSTILANPTLSQLFRADSTSGFFSCKKVDFVPSVTTTLSQQLKSNVLMNSSILQNSLDHDSLSAALSQIDSLPPALGERWDFVPVFPLSSLVYANSSLKATAYWPRLGLPGFEPHRPRPRWTLATLAAPRQLLPRRADFGLGGPFGRP